MKQQQQQCTKRMNNVAPPGGWGGRMSCRLTLSNSGSHESNVSERTLEKWTPKLLKVKHKEQKMGEKIWDFFVFPSYFD